MLKIRDIKANFSKKCKNRYKDQYKQENSKELKANLLIMINLWIKKKRHIAWKQTKKTNVSLIYTQLLIV